MQDRRPRWQCPFNSDDILQHGYIGNAYIGEITGPFEKPHWFPKPYRIESPFLYKSKFYKTQKSARKHLVDAYRYWQEQVAADRNHDHFKGGISR